MIITSLNNEKIKYLTKLNQKKYRSDTFLVEGKHLVEEAYKKNLVKLLIVLEDYKLDNIDNVDTIKVSYDVMKKISLTDTPPKIMAEVIKKEDKKGRTLKVIKGTDGQQIIKENKKDINTYITKKAKIAGEKSPAGSYLKKLIDERSKYENELNSGAEYVTSPESGVVSYKVDGYEKILTTANFNYLNKDFLKSLKLKVGQVIATSQESGKIIDNFKCYIACVLNSNESKQAKIRRRVKIKTTKWKRS